MTTQEVAPSAPDVPRLAGLPLNRVIAFAGPYISVLAGIVATWLTTNVHLFSTFHIGTNDVAAAIGDGLVFGVTALVVWLGQHKWLDGFQKWAYETAAVVEGLPPVEAAPPPVVPPRR